MDRHNRLFVSNRPLGVRSLIDGGFIGYSGGNSSIPWYSPFSYLSSGGVRVERERSLLSE